MLIKFVIAGIWSATWQRNWRSWRGERSEPSPSSSVSIPSQLHVEALDCRHQLTPLHKHTEVWIINCWSLQGFPGSTEGWSHLMTTPVLFPQWCHQQSEDRCICYKGKTVFQCERSETHRERVGRRIISSFVLIFIFFSLFLCKPWGQLSEQPFKKSFMATRT